MQSMRIRVKVTPGARRERVEETKSQTLAISVREKAERGEANERVLALVARHACVPRSRVRLISGRTGRNKTIEVVE